MKKIILSISFFCLAVSTEAQSFEEYISVNAYPHYTLKIAKHEQNGVVLIPKDERIDSFSLFVSISQFDENRHSLGKVLNKFKEAVDTTSTISIIEQEEKTKYPFLLFTLEKQATNEEVAKSDLYYIIQGKEILFIVYTEIKKELFDTDFISKWKEIFKNSKVVTK